MAEHSESSDRPKTSGGEKREYFSPKIVHSEKMTTRAVSCNKADDTSCAAGPINS